MEEWSHERTTGFCKKCKTKKEVEEEKVVLDSVFSSGKRKVSLHGLQEHLWKADRWVKCELWDQCHPNLLNSGGEEAANAWILHGCMDTPVHVTASRKMLGVLFVGRKFINYAI